MPGIALHLSFFLSLSSFCCEKHVLSSILTFNWFLVLVYNEAEIRPMRGVQGLCVDSSQHEMYRNFLY